MISQLPLEGAFEFTPRRYSDSRGWFVEHFNAATLAEQSFSREFVQDNLSFSATAGTLRGLHYQSPPMAQGKLVSVITGAVRDVIVDIREGSPTFGEHIAVELSAENGKQLWVPEGFLHGFVTLTHETRVLYKVTAHYSNTHDGSIAWDDPQFGIDWGVQNPILSDKDAAAPRFAEVNAIFPEGWDRK